MLLRPFPVRTHSPDEKIEPLTWRTNAQDFRYIPLSDLAPGLGPPCPWLDMDLLLLHGTASSPRLRISQTKDCAVKREGAAHRGGERPNVDC
jgi:hypothetical protein